MSRNISTSDGKKTITLAELLILQTRGPRAFKKRAGGVAALLSAWGSVHYYKRGNYFILPSAYLDGDKVIICSSKIAADSPMARENFSKDN
ncbi:MAG TPA: hypothetical protein VGO63_02685 [Candidatus Paceibacterota bacterium]|jgi:hypothetical protein|nr:hypothetical protein [Candidatus Paceibacterota bacterium]